MTIQEFIKLTFRPTKTGHCFRPHIVCKDGFTMSVQGSTGMYCSPRETRDNYTDLEIGFPNRVEPLILEYADDSNTPTDTVYGYVPIEVIDQVIEVHGGIDVNNIDWLGVEL